MTNPLPLIHRSSSSPTMFSSLPDEIIMDCLARISKSYYRSICLVSKSFNLFLSSPEIYKARSQIGATEHRLYVCLWLPTSPNHRWFTLSEMNGMLSFVPIRQASSSLCPPTPLYENTVSVGSEIYQIGGTVNNTQCTEVHVLDCRTHTWRRGPNMTVARKLVKSWYLDGKIYTIGISVNREKPMNSGEVLDLKTQTWKPLFFPSDHEDNCFAFFGGRLYVSYVTSEKTYAYDPKEETWVRDESGFLELGPFSIYPSLCLIDKLIFSVSFDDKYIWYNPHCKKWTRICGLDDFCREQGDFGYTVRLVNYGGKLLVVWHKEEDYLVNYVKREIRIWCTLIRLEERKTPSGLEIWGKTERSNYVLQVPESYWLLSCVSALV